jgi:hypothetical protein
MIDVQHSTHHIPALTVHQPWVWPIAHGWKPIENRTWSTAYRGPLAIHAGVRWDHDGATDARVIHAVNASGHQGFDPPLRVVLNESRMRIVELLPDPIRFPLAALVAVVDLVSICAIRIGCECGAWAASGQFHWRLTNPRLLLAPVPCKGNRRLWRLPTPVEAEVSGQIEVKPRQTPTPADVSATRAPSAGSA